MTIKSLLRTVSLALLLGAIASTAQAQIPIGQLADYSGATSDVPPDRSSRWPSEICCALAEAVPSKSASETVLKRDFIVISVFLRSFD